MFEAYCDASGIFAERFQSIGIISGNTANLERLRNELTSILESNDIKEIKFVGIKRQDSKKDRTAQQFIFRTINEFIALGLTRVDVLTWDTTDSRHSTPGRNDSENLGILYYHLLCNLTKRYPRAYWNVIVDKDEKVNFDTLRDCINNKMLQPPIAPSLELIVSSRQIEALETVKDIREAESDEEPLVQLADLFAGMARFSREKGIECCNWLAIYGNPEQPPFPDLLAQLGIQDYGKSDECRFKLIGELCRVCKKHRLGVNINKRKYLWTPDPTSPINFWPYEPQSEYDKAPVKRQ